MRLLAESTVNNKVYIMTRFLRWYEWRSSIKGIPALREVKLNKLADYAAHLLERELSLKSVKTEIYSIATDLTNLEMFQSNDIWEIERLRLLKKQISKLASKEEVLKAALIFQSKLEDIHPAFIFRITCWALSGFRYSSWSNLTNICITNESIILNTGVVKNYYALDGIVFAHISCNCSITGHAINSKLLLELKKFDLARGRYCPLCDSMVDPSKVKAEIEASVPKAIMKILSISSHSMRRTMAWNFRWLMENWEEIKPLLVVATPNDSLACINSAMQWSAKSRSLYEYTKDFELYSVRDILDLRIAAINTINCIAVTLRVAIKNCKKQKFEADILQKVVENPIFDGFEYTPELADSVVW
ncbi:MAG: hypothetical protein QF732_02945 [Nitrospinaceae bacterium]|jgi:hypothetical protein|nr:hypothetical protein [Nitrospinaceae bacterium]